MAEEWIINASRNEEGVYVCFFCQTPCQRETLNVVSINQPTPDELATGK